MKTDFIHDDFLLQTKQAQRLYHEYAEDMPIIDYHCHLNPSEVMDDIRWDNITQVWLYGDHYKWRAMRSNGIDEKYCTGDATDREKFDKFAETMPYLLRNPMYHWSHLELVRYFNVNKLLSPATADEIWERTKERLAEPDMSARGLMLASNVEVVCTTDDPVDILDAHKKIASETDFKIKVLPTWRPDKGMAVDNLLLFNEWVDKLSAVSGIDIGDDYFLFIDAIANRHDYFHANGCRLSDHGVETVYFEDCTESEMSRIFAKARSGADLSENDIIKFKSGMMLHFGRMDAAKGWVQQIHYGALRNNNSVMFERLGPDTGFDSIGDWPIAVGLSKFMDKLNSEDRLPKTIIYTLNPRDNELLGTMIGNFQGDGIPGKIQFGSGWWFNDQKDGMERQIEALSQLGLLSRFVGMLTDSRSFLSYTRHEYFRRILCNILGNDMRAGLIPDDYELVGRMVADICYNNAREYFFK